MPCPSCRESDMSYVRSLCADTTYEVCRSCDYGINEHTEGTCECNGLCPVDGARLDYNGKCAECLREEMRWDA